MNNFNTLGESNVEERVDMDTNVDDQNRNKCRDKQQQDRKKKGSIHERVQRARKR